MIKWNHVMFVMIQSIYTIVSNVNTITVRRIIKCENTTFTASTVKLTC